MPQAVPSLKHPHQVAFINGGQLLLGASLKYLGAFGVAPTPWTFIVVVALFVVLSVVVVVVFVVGDCVVVFLVVVVGFVAENSEDA